LKKTKGKRPHQKGKHFNIKKWEEKTFVADISELKVKVEPRWVLTTASLERAITERD
jgi:hypothetical protein